MTEGVTPLEVMLGTMRALWADAWLGEQMDADKAAQASAVAKDAAPYMHARLQSTELTGKDGAAIQVSDPGGLEVVRRLALLLSRVGIDGPSR